VVATWLKDGRKYDVHPAIPDIRAYSDAWWAWWTSLQPKWRVVFMENLSQETPPAGEMWSMCLKAGCNGIFVVFLTIAWWILVEKATKKRAPLSRDALADTVWVLDHMIQFLKSKKRTSDDSLGSEHATKRR
jgi:hypothetical protein